MQSLLFLEDVLWLGDSLALGKGRFRFQASVHAYGRAWKGPHLQICEHVLSYSIIFIVDVFVCEQVSGLYTDVKCGRQCATVCIERILLVQAFTMGKLMVGHLMI